jgi:Ca2+-binding RTX toxin-like protein
VRSRDPHLRSRLRERARPRARLHHLTSSTTNQGETDVHPHPIRSPGAVVATGVVGGGLAPSAGAAQPPYKVQTHNRTLAITARGAGADLALRLAAGNPQVLQLDVGDDSWAEYSVARGRFDRVAVAAGSANNRVRVDEGNGVFTTATPTTIDGQGGDDFLMAGSGNETLLGGDGSDFIDAGRGADAVDTGAGNDAFIWELGQGSDTFEGGAGSDVIFFDGATGAEQFGVVANGNRVRFTRDLGGIVMDLHGVEKIQTNAVAGADTFTAGDLGGTDTTVLQVSLGAVDGATDRVIVNGTDNGDAIRASGTSTRVTVSGLAARLDIEGAQLTGDKPAIFGLAGNDIIDGSDLTADALELAADGAGGNDILRGGEGNDTLVGADGADLLAGGPGVDALDGGAGSNTLVQD